MQADTAGMVSSGRRSWVARFVLVVILLAGLALEPAGPALAQSAAPPLAYPLEGTRWRLAEMLDQGASRPVGPEVTALLHLSEGRARGFDGCSRLRGRYRVGPEAPSSDGLGAGPSVAPDPSAGALAEDARVLFEAIRRGTRTCAEQTMLVVQGLHAGLARSAGYRLIPAEMPWQTTLELLDAAGQPLLRFGVDDAGTLAAMIWTLESVDDAQARTASDGQPATVVFDAGGPSGREGRAVRERLEAEGRVEREPRRVVGSTACNGFDGRYVVTGHVLSIADLTSETEPCPPALAAQEVATLDILDATSLSVSLPPGALELRSDDDGRTLRFRPGVTLEDQQWVLDRRSNRRLESDEVVTLFLVPDEPASQDGVRSGTITGEGPCGAYEGTYRTDGLLVRIDEVAGPAGSCADRRAERRYLRALRQATFADVRGLGLALLDGRGQPQLVFTTPGSL
jgi:heat shock protein HslJ